MKLLRASVVLAGLAGVFAMSNCTQNNKPEIVKVANAKTKEVIDLERIELKKKEGDFVKKLDRWTMWLDMVSSHLRDENMDNPYVQLNFTGQEFLGTIMGHCDAIVPPETALEKVTDEVNRVVRSIVPPKRQKTDFHVQPSKDQVDAYIKLITMADKVAPSVTLDGVLNKVENNSKKRNRPEENIKESKELASETFEIYTKMFDDLAKEKPKLIQALEKFNEDARVAGQAPYEPTWGLSLELLKSLKSIK